MARATATGWVFTEAPPAAGVMWRQVFPAAGEAPGRVAWLGMSAAGLFRASVVTACWLVALSVAGRDPGGGRFTRIRAAVGLGLIVLVAAVAVVAHVIVVHTTPS